MASLSKVTVGWEGVAVIGAGSSVFYTTGSGSALNNDLRTFFGALVTLMPNLKGKWTFAGAGPVIDSATGDLTGSWSGGSTTDVNWASSNATWASGVGTRIVWNTGAFLRGRRTRGSTFIVPLNLSMIDADGTIVGSALTTLTTAGDALIAAHPGLTIWSRPTAAGGDGGSTSVTGCSAPDKVSWLRSRRT